MFLKQRENTCVRGRGKCVMVNQISGKVDVRDSKAFRTFLLGFSSPSGINLVQHQQSRRVHHCK